MRKEYYKPLLFLLGISFFIRFFVAYYNNIVINIPEIFSLISQTVTINVIIISLFIKWGWRWKIFKWLIPFPDLNGTWQGTIKSTWKNPRTNDITEPIPVVLTINQSLINCSLVMKTGEMTSYSYSESFRIVKDRQIKQLIFNYKSEPNPTVKNRSQIHNGTALLDIIEKPTLKLKGVYWTDRKTTGELCLTLYNKILTNNYLEKLGPHPLSLK